MKIILFGATGMIGTGVLRECLLDPTVESVLSVGRAQTGQKHEKLRELVHGDLSDLSAIEAELADFDACFFCLGVSSAGKTEQEYHRVTHDYTLAAAQVVARQNPGVVFIYVSGAGTDSTEQGSSMWARVKGKTENALLKMAFLDAYMFRPGFIQPLHGATSRTKLYRVLYRVLAPVIPLVKVLHPNMITTECIGRAMLNVARNGWPQRVLEPGDIGKASVASS